MVRDRAHLAGPAPALRRARLPARVRRGRRREGPGRVPRRPLVAARDRRGGSSVRRDRRALLPGGAPRHRRRAAAGGRCSRSSGTRTTWPRRCASTPTRSWRGSARMRAAGVTLPVHLGTPGVAELTKLMTISARIGVADSARYLKKNRKMVGPAALARAASAPTRCWRGWRHALGDPGGRRRGAPPVHVQPGRRRRVDWQQRHARRARRSRLSRQREGWSWSIPNVSGMQLVGSAVPGERGHGGADDRVPR